MRPPRAAGPGLLLALALALLATALAAGERAAVGQALLEPFVLALLPGAHERLAALDRERERIETEIAQARVQSGRPLAGEPRRD